MILRIEQNVKILTFKLHLLLVLLNKFNFPNYCLLVFIVKFDGVMWLFILFIFAVKSLIVYFNFCSKAEKVTLNDPTTGVQNFILRLQMFRLGGHRTRTFETSGFAAEYPATLFAYESCL